MKSNISTISKQLMSEGYLTTCLKLRNSVKEFKHQAKCYLIMDNRQMDEAIDADQLPVSDLRYLTVVCFASNEVFIKNYGCPKLVVKLARKLAVDLSKQYHLPVVSAKHGLIFKGDK